MVLEAVTFLPLFYYGGCMKSKRIDLPVCRTLEHLCKRNGEETRFMVEKALIRADSILSTGRELSPDPSYGASKKRIRFTMSAELRTLADRVYAKCSIKDSNEFLRCVLYTYLKRGD